MRALFKRKGVVGEAEKRKGKRWWDRVKQRCAPLLAALTLTSCMFTKVRKEEYGRGNIRVAEYFDLNTAGGSEEIHADLNALATEKQIEEDGERRFLGELNLGAVPYFRFGPMEGAEWEPETLSGRVIAGPLRGRMGGLSLMGWPAANVSIINVPIIDIYQDVSTPVPVSLGASYLYLQFKEDDEQKTKNLFTFRLIRFGLDRPFSLGFYANAFLSKDLSWWGGYGGFEMTGQLGGPNRLFRLYTSLGYRNMRFENAELPSTFSFYASFSYYIPEIFLLLFASYHRPALSSSSSLEVSDYFRIGVALTGGCQTVFRAAYDPLNKTLFLSIDLLNYPLAVDFNADTSGCFTYKHVPRRIEEEEETPSESREESAPSQPEEEEEGEITGPGGSPACELDPLLCEYIQEQEERDRRLLESDDEQERSGDEE